jgi:predicted AAA+ superfamily ATPase
MAIYIKRTLSSLLLEIRHQFPVLAVFGPRQSGKTTLTRELFPQYRYINLESFEEREFAETDGKGFLERFHNDSGVILDEIQKAPKLLSYIQLEVDEKPQMGRFILTGSQNILLNQHISQTLAGRTAFTTLLPLSIEELKKADLLPESYSQMIFQGFYPRIYQHHANPAIFAESYMRTYVERDVRDIKQISSLSDFQKFMRLCAGRIGQLLNLTALANDAGLSLPTVKSWLSILEASYVIFLLQPFHINYNKRIVKMPKLYFYDTALACSLLRITNSEDVYDHYLKGGLFESMIISDMMKRRFHHGLPPNVYFWRDKTGHEIDCLLEEGATLTPLEIKSSATITSEMFDGLARWSSMTNSALENGVLIYGGHEKQKRKYGQVLSWQNLSSKMP